MKPRTDPAKKVAKKRGRPPKPAGETRTASLRLRLHVTEREELEQAANAEGSTVTQLILDAVRYYRERD